MVASVIRTTLTLPADLLARVDQAVRQGRARSRNASNAVIGVPCSTLRAGRRVYPSQVLLHAGEAGLDHDSVALAEQVRALAKSRLGRQWGTLRPPTLRQLERALAIALELPLTSTPRD